MSTPTDDQLATLGAAFEAFARRYKLAETLGTDRPLNELDKHALLYLAEHPGSGPSDVARFLGVAATTVSSATDRLVKRGLLERRRPDDDRRAVALSLTAEGKARVAALLATHREINRRMLAPLSEAERAAFIALITKIVYSED